MKCQDCMYLTRSIDRDPCSSCKHVETGSEDRFFPSTVLLEEKEPNDPVNHPSHYTDGKIEVADYIADKHFDFFLGNAIKYISRAGKKDPSKHVEDLEKAIWYINYEIKLLKGENNDKDC